MKYFYRCANIEECHNLYKQLVKKLHPDIGGIADEFIAMKEEYEEAIKVGFHRANGEGRDFYHYYHETQRLKVQLQDLERRERNSQEYIRRLEEGIELKRKDCKHYEEIVNSMNHKSLWNRIIWALKNTKRKV